MKTLLALLTALLLSSTALAGPWTTIGTAELSRSGKSITIDIGEKIGKIDNLRLNVDDQPVRFISVKAIPIKGDPVTLKVTEYLKPGESSGLINIPGMPVTLACIVIEYSITSETSSPAKVTLRVKAD